MADFFHVARKDISELSEFELDINDWFIECENLYTKEEFCKIKFDLYPFGLSSHGKSYLHHLFNFSDSLETNHFSIEIIFELIRRLKFPERQSRFTSFFGCLTLDDARNLRSINFDNNGIIYKVACENFHVADMSLLTLKGSILGIEVIAE